VVGHRETCWRRRVPSGSRPALEPCPESAGRQTTVCPGFFTAFVVVSHVTSQAEAVGGLLLLVGFLFATEAETGLLGALFVAGGTYALLLPRLVRSSGR
jgi:hypothetical protein